MTTHATLEKVTWPVIYGGMFLAILGAALWRNDEAAGVPLMAVGTVVTAIGAGLVWWRARLGDADVVLAAAAASTNHRASDT